MTLLKTVNSQKVLESYMRNVGDFGVWANSKLSWFNAEMLNLQLTWKVLKRFQILSFMCQNFTFWNSLILATGRCRNFSSEWPMAQTEFLIIKTSSYRHLQKSFSNVSMRYDHLWMKTVNTQKALCRYIMKSWRLQKSLAWLHRTPIWSFFTQRILKFVDKFQAISSDIGPLLIHCRDVSTVDL